MAITHKLPRLLG